MRAWFFYRYGESNTRLNYISERKKAERNRNTLSNFGEDGDRQLDEQERILREQSEKSHCYDEGELKNRLDSAIHDIWYVSLLANNDVTKFQSIRQCLYIDIINAIINKIKQSR